MEIKFDAKTMLANRSLTIAFLKIKDWKGVSQTTINTELLIQLGDLMKPLKKMGFENVEVCIGGKETPLMIKLTDDTVFGIMQIQKE